MRAKRVLLVVVILTCTVSLAGCSGLDSSGTGTGTDPVSTEPAGDTPEDSQSDQQGDTEAVPVVGGELGVDQNTVFAQLNALLGTNVTAPERIVVPEEEFTGGSPALDDPFSLLIDEESRSPGYSGTYADGEITIVTANRTKADIEATLVHEFVHHVQAKKDLEIPEASATSYYESGLIENALDEGGAVYITNEYIMEYMDWQQLEADQIAFATSRYDGRFSINESAVESQIDYTEAGYKQANAADRFFAAPYYYGSQYLAERNLTLNEYFALYENPPTTTEQLIHGYEPGEEKPVPLELNSTGVSGENVITSGPLGELTLRLTLFSELNERRAVRAAEGWGNDTSVGTVTGDSKPGLIWTIRMDTESDGQQLQTAMRAYLDGRATKTDGVWFDEDDSLYLTADSPDNRTVVLAIGAEPFVRSLTVSSDGETVRVETSSSTTG